MRCLLILFCVMALFPYRQILAGKTKDFPGGEKAAMSVASKACLASSEAGFSAGKIKRHKKKDDGHIYKMNMTKMEGTKEAKIKCKVRLKYDLSIQYVKHKIGKNGDYKVVKQAAKKKVATRKERLKVANNACNKTAAGFEILKTDPDSAVYKVTMKKSAGGKEEKVKCKVRVEDDLKVKYVKYKGKTDKAYIEKILTVKDKLKIKVSV